MIKTFKIKTLTAVVGASLAAMSLGVSASEQITVQKFANSGVVNYVAGNLGTTTQKNAVDSLKNILASQDAYHVSGSEDFTVRRQWIDELGKAHTHFTQTINGLTVYGTSMILHADVTENSLTSTSGQVYALTGSLTESCTGSQSGGIYYVRLKAYQAFSGVSITASYNDGGTTPPPPPPPGNEPIDETQTGISVSQGQWTRYTQQLGAGYSQLEVTISGGSGDADLYVRHGSQSTSSSYDCRPYKSGNNETCTFNNPQSGTWYIDLYGYSSASNVTLNVKGTP
ncbi:PPC domain-containing protein [Aliikangiella maris]|uniref:Pre-peptidase C-terminal domain-containing protein n=1 Tax=Aliikangiella maris TaxID=3162458 RepID=A0ABV2BY78_9GAMM